MNTEKLKNAKKFYDKFISLQSNEDFVFWKENVVDVEIKRVKDMPSRLDLNTEEGQKKAITYLLVGQELEKVFETIFKTADSQITVINEQLAKANNPDT